jgi:hypothetical protein
MLGIVPTSSLHPATRRIQRDTFNGVFSCSASFLHPPTHAEHDETPTMVSFHAWRRFLTFHVHVCPPNTKGHQHWCLFVLGAVSTSTQVARRTRKSTNTGCLCVFTSFFTLMPAEHAKTQMLGGFVCLASFLRHAIMSGGGFILFLGTFQYDGGAGPLHRRFIYII